MMWDPPVDQFTPKKQLSQQPSVYATSAGWELGRNEFLEALLSSGFYPKTQRLSQCYVGVLAWRIHHEDLLRECP